LALVIHSSTASTCFSAISYRAIDPEQDIAVLDLPVVLDERIGDEAGDIRSDRNHIGANMAIAGPGHFKIIVPQLVAGPERVFLNVAITVYLMVRVAAAGDGLTAGPHLRGYSARCHRHDFANSM
jgi:hypothetical protein